MRNILLIVALLFAASTLSARAEDGTSLALVFQREVDMRLELPQEAQEHYAQILDAELKRAGTPIATSQYVLMVDRNPNVQAIFVYWLDAQASSDRWHFIGASPASTGKPGQFDHFLTPLGVFAHLLSNLDYRAEGTLNNLGIRGLGRKDMRVFDFGWVQGERGWGKGGKSQMRLLLHATDPDHLEQRLGAAMSKGCIRIPSTLNTFIDRYGLLDAVYEQALAKRKKLWMLRNDRIPTPWTGSYLVIVDSGNTERPVWSPQPPVASKLHSKNKQGRK
ncbi:MAG: murein L,D-transpeptidase [Gallionellaceae bacterium]|nr:MAG: murein L,D-transpeptidase [Gallionellaceae bacterium]